MKALVAAVAVASSLFAVHAHAAAVEGGSDALSRIEQAYAEGRIDAPTRALLGLKLVRDARSLPAEFRPAAGEAPVRCGTLLVRRAQQEHVTGSFSPEQEEQFFGGIARPTLDTNVAVFDSAGSTIIATLHWDSGSTTQPQADAAVAFLTESWTAQVETMGWRTPPLDGGIGGNNPGDEIDIYLDPAASSALTVAESAGPETWDDRSAFVVLDPTVPNIQTFLAHELNHVLQYAYDGSEADFLYEATAVWMEDQVYDSVNDYVDFIGDFQTHPERTLTFATYDDLYMYGGAVFVHYLASLGGGALIEDIWDGSKQSDTTNSVDFFDAIEAQSAATGFTEMEDLYAEFAGVRFLTGAQSDGTLEEGAQMDAVAALATTTLDELEGGTSANPPMGLGANYIVVNTSGAEPDDTIKIEVTASSAQPWAITVVEVPASGSANVNVVRQDGTSLEATTGALDGISTVVFAVSPLIGVDGGPDRAQTGGGHSADISTHGFSWSFEKEKAAAGCGCTLPSRSKPHANAQVLGLLALALGAVAVRRNHSGA